MYNDMEEAELRRLHQALFDTAKLRWGIGMTIGVLAIIVAPAAFLFDYPRWIGLTTATTMSAIGFGLRWWSEYVRADADKLLTTTDLISAGFPPDNILVASVRAKYVRIARKTSQEERREGGPYNEATGDPSIELLVIRMRESAWWTAQLAAKARTLICIPGCLAALAILVSYVAADSISLRTYAMSICVVILLDMLYLGSRYGRLSKGSEMSFSRLSMLLNDAGASEHEALVEAVQYHSKRDSSPLVPTWVWCLWRSSLNCAWMPLSTVHKGHFGKSSKP